MMRQCHGPSSLPPLLPPRLPPTHQVLRRLPHLLFLLFLFSLTSCSSGVAAQSKSERRHPMLSSIPDTSFRCLGHTVGYYADLETDCQVYHMCDTLGKQYSYLCPNHTLFHQKFMVCDHWYMVDCSEAPQFYHLNDKIGQVPDEEGDREGRENKIDTSDPSSSSLKSSLSSSSTPLKSSLSAASPLKTSLPSSSLPKPSVSASSPLKGSVSSSSSTSPLKPLTPANSPFKVSISSSTSSPKRRFSFSSFSSKFPVTPSTSFLRPSSTPSPIKSTVASPRSPVPHSSSLKPFVPRSSAKPVSLSSRLSVTPAPPSRKLSPPSRKLSPPPSSTPSLDAFTSSSVTLPTTPLSRKSSLEPLTNSSRFISSTPKSTPFSFSTKAPISVSSAMLKPFRPTPSPFHTHSRISTPPASVRGRQPATLGIRQPNAPSVRLPVTPFSHTHASRFSSERIGPPSRFFSLPTLPFAPRLLPDPALKLPKPDSTILPSKPLVLKEEIINDNAVLDRTKTEVFNSEVTNKKLPNIDSNITISDIDSNPVFTTTVAPISIAQFTMMPANVARKPGNRFIFSSDNVSKPVFTPEDLQQLVFRPLVVRPFIKPRKIHIPAEHRKEKHEIISTPSPIPDLSEASRGSTPTRFFSQANDVDSSAFATPPSLAGSTDNAHQSQPTKATNTSFSLRPLAISPPNLLQPPLNSFSPIIVSSFLSPPRQTFSPIKRMKQEFLTPLSVPARSRNTQFLVPNNGNINFKFTPRGNRQFFIPPPIQETDSVKSNRINSKTSHFNRVGGISIHQTSNQASVTESENLNHHDDMHSHSHSGDHGHGISGMTMVFPAPPETRMEELRLNPDCPRCHPAFLRPGECHPCVFIK